MSRLTLKDQLRQLDEQDAPPPTLDPESAYTSLDSNDISARAGDEGREHYLDVGPSKLRAQRSDVSQSLLGDKYEGKRVGRMKIFDDDEDEDEAAPFGAVEDDEDEESNMGSDDDGEDDDGDEDEEDDEEEGDEDDEDDDDDEEEEDEEDEGDEEEEEEGRAGRPQVSVPTVKTASRALDPVGALREARMKDLEKGRGIKRQKALFDTLLTLRITYQKALTAAALLNQPLPEDPSGQLGEQRNAVMASLADLNEKLLEVRTALVLPGTDVPELGKRKRGDDTVDEAYIVSAAQDSLGLVDAEHPQMLGILNKWSSKIQVASMAVTSKAAGSSKFLQGTKGQTGVVDAIDAGLASKRDSDKTFLESEEGGYRGLLKEVIDSRSGASGGVDLSHLRRERKKKREEERGGSKGRKLRYTIHEKAQNFVVPIPLRQGWHEEQIDELFSSLLGGAGEKGAQSEGILGANETSTAGEGGLAGLGGLRVF